MRVESLVGGHTQLKTGFAMTTQQTAPKFGSYLVWDVGASDPVCGSGKGGLYSNSGELLQTIESRKVAPKGVKDSTEFVKELSERSKEVLKPFADKIKLDPLEQVIIFIPGVMKGTVSSALENVFSKTGQPLENLDFGVLPAELSNYANKPISILLANDMVGSAAATIAALKVHPELKKDINTDGYKALLAMLGGGLGVIEIQRHGDNVTLNATEGGHLTPLHKTLFPTGKEVLEDEATSTGALIRNIARRLGLPEEHMVRTADVRLSMGMPIKLPADHPSLKYLEPTGKFLITPASGNQVNIQLTESPEKIQVAGMGAIQDTIRGLAQVAQIETLKGTNALILIGPMVTRINKFLNKFQDTARRIFGVSGFEPVTLKSILNKHIEANADILEKAMMKGSNFKIITELPVTNNAAGGTVFRNATQIGPWTYRYRIPSPVQANVPEKAPEPKSTITA